MGEEGVLLGLVEAVDLVQEEDEAPFALASSTAWRTSLSPASTAESLRKGLPTPSARSRARVVLPVPGGPKRTMEESRPASSIRLRSPWGPVRWGWPRTSSKLRGLRRSARGSTSLMVKGLW